MGAAIRVEHGRRRLKAGLLSAVASGERQGFAYRGVCAGAERIGAVLGEAGRMPMMDFASLCVFVAVRYIRTRVALLAQGAPYSIYPTLPRAGIDNT